MEKWCTLGGQLDVLTLKTVIISMQISLPADWYQWFLSLAIMGSQD